MIPNNRLADHLPLWDVTSSGYLRDLPNRFNDKAIKTVNNVLTVLNTLLKKAAEWRVIDDMPCTIRLLKVPEGLIQELAGHRDLTTTQKYMHLSPSAITDAIRLLDGADPRGDIVESVP